MALVEKSPLSYIVNRSRRSITAASKVSAEWNPGRNRNTDILSWYNVFFTVRRCHVSRGMKTFSQAPCTDCTTTRLTLFCAQLKCHYGGSESGERHTTGL